MNVFSRLRRAALLVCLLLFCLRGPAFCAELDFDEVWAYLMAGEERFFDPKQPISDLAYFGAGIDNYGKLTRLPDRSRIKNFKGRVHLVVAEVGNYALTHFCLNPDYPLRNALVADLALAARSFDGLQIDFETLTAKDYENFFDFLVSLKAQLGAKTLSVALPARLNARTDLFGYARIAKVADRVVVMAYDEHWSGSEPGPVASIEWCEKVAAYALSTMPANKLVMGAPFYGRAWGDKVTSRAYKYSSLVALLEDKGGYSPGRRNQIPFVEYTELVGVKVFFDDALSSQARLGMYRRAGVSRIAFWRLGQEAPGIWSGIGLRGSGRRGGRFFEIDPRFLALMRQRRALAGGAVKTNRALCGPLGHDSEASRGSRGGF